MQQITITGFLSKDAETRTTQSGQTVTSLNVPVRQGYGEREQTNWFRVNVWGKRADYAGKFRKGEFVCVTGELAIGEYNGKPQYEIDAKDFASVRPAPKSDAGNAGQQSGGGWAHIETSRADLDDEIPF